MASVGTVLRSGREAQGRSVEDIAQELCIMPSYVRAMEKDDAADLPGTFFYKSFVRQYATIVGLNPAELVAEVEAVTAVAEPVTTVAEKKPIRVPDPIVEASNNFNFSSRSLTAPLVALAVALIGGGIFYAWWKRPVEAAQTPAPVVVEKQPEVVPIAATTTVAPISTPVAETASNDSPVAVTTTTTTTADGVKHIELSLSAKEKTWLSISSGGKQIFSGVLEAEETKTLSGLEMAKMTVGNAGGIDVHLNGKDVGPLGAKGQVRVVVFTPEGFSFLSNTL
jgi:cytoskeletal protein RodZ